MLKKSFVILMLLILSSQPAKALQPITDSEMKKITGGTGISMVLDDFSIYIPIDQIIYTDAADTDYSWYDATYAGVAQGAQMVINDFELDYNIEAISESGQIGNSSPKFNLAQSDDIDTANFHFKPLTFDVASNAPSLFWNPSTTDSRTAFIIGSPTMEIYINELKFDELRFRILHAATRKAYSNNAVLFGMSIKGLDIATLDGQIAFMSHASSGVDIGMDDIQIYMKIDEIRFTDTDGMYVPMILNTYVNIPQQINPNQQAMPYSIALRDIEIDTLRINSLYFSSIPAEGDTTTTPEISSPGNTGAHIKTSANESDPLRRLDNFKRKDMPDSTLYSDLRGCPLQIDIGSNLPTATVLGVNPNAVGIRISLPTQELYAKKIFIGGIYVSDPLKPTPGNDYSEEEFVNYPALLTGTGNKGDVYRPVYNNDTSFMQVRMEESLTTILSGNMEIFAH